MPKTDSLRMIVQRRRGGKITEAECVLPMQTPERLAQRIAAELDETRGRTAGNVVGLYIGAREPEKAFAPDRTAQRVPYTEAEPCE